MADRHLVLTTVRVALFTAALWAIQAAGSLLALPHGFLGVRPGTLTGLHGILTAPLVHGSYPHLMANTAPLLVLGVATLYGFPRAARIALPMIWLGSGLGVWLFAREATHLGASGLAHGMLFFVFIMGVLRRDRPSIALALVVFFLYGGMLWGVLPGRPGISYESHFFGAVAGTVAAVMLRHRDPFTGRQAFTWERESAAPAGSDGQGEDPIIGDLWRDAEAPEVPRRRDDHHP